MPDAPQVSGIGSQRRTGPLRNRSYVGPTGGYPQTLRHLGDLIRQQRRKKVLQEQNGQGNFDTLTGHHQQSPGQHRGTTHGSTEGNGDSEKLTFPISIPVIILPANGTVHHEVHLQGVRELGAGSSGKRKPKKRHGQKPSNSTPISPIA